MKIYHIVPTEIWSKFSGAQYEAESLTSEGFIHCSFAEQIEAVLKRYFGGVHSVTVLEIDPAKLTSKLVVEPSTGGEDFPHIYGAINLDAVIAAERRSIT